MLAGDLALDALDAVGDVFGGTAGLVGEALDLIGNNGKAFAGLVTRR